MINMQRLRQVGPVFAMLGGAGIAAALFRPAATAAAPKPQTASGLRHDLRSPSERSELSVKCGGQVALSPPGNALSRPRRVCGVNAARLAILGDLSLTIRASGYTPATTTDLWVNPGRERRDNEEVALAGSGQRAKRDIASRAQAVVAWLHTHLSSTGYQGKHRAVR
jgi:hypothetical protein